jgi:AIG2-like family
VWGLLFTVTSDEIAALDRYEGHPKHYTRIFVTVLASDGPTVAWTYTVRAKRPFVPPARRYMAAMIAAAQSHLLPEEYVAALRAVRSVDG